ncbi:uncharacterized protein LOC110858532 [Folsomia candida]|uniref:Diacylglycerol kinase 1 n=1 Tax=Folsomia candida TaxID=158441 RepID=A0A226DGT1_FOLCA|nr:uncharacterized protein LOC110858532 [Folsomia candida]OXA43811.1 Diacylglycerol kinase 1 [Folsomia candida]
MAEQAFYVILFLATISIAEAAVRNNTFGNDFTSNAIPGSSSLDDLAGDRKAAADLQAKIEAIHQHDPRSSLQLAQEVLTRVFEQFHAKTGGDHVPISQLIERMGETQGKTTLYLFRLISFMDTDNDYKISKNEFANFFMGPAGHPDMLIDLLLRIQDTDQNGVLSAYELLWNEVMSLGINYNLFDMWRSANQKLSELDLNDDGMVDTSEWGHYVIFNINEALVQQRVDGSK